MAESPKLSPRQERLLDRLSRELKSVAAYQSNEELQQSIRGAPDPKLLDIACSEVSQQEPKPDKHGNFPLRLTFKSIKTPSKRKK